MSPTLYSILVVVALGLACVAAETLLRLSGHRPRAPRAPLWRPPNEPVMHEADLVLGWRTKPGVYVVPGYPLGTPPMRMTVWPDGSRATAVRQEKRTPTIVLLGDSFTYGWAVSDDETYAWGLQQRLPLASVVNYGTAGYNTLQATLRLAEAHRTSRLSPRLVVYGFNDDQDKRNVAALSWLRMLGTQNRVATAVPYCLLGQGRSLACHPPEALRRWPFTERFSTVAFLEDRYAAWRDRGRLAQSQTVTELLIEEMSRAARSMGGELVVAVLGTGLGHYTHYLQRSGIRFVDCDDPPWPTMVVPEGHPTASRHALWADCIASALRDEIEVSSRGPGGGAP